MAPARPPVTNVRRPGVASPVTDEKPAATPKPAEAYRPGKYKEPIEAWHGMVGVLLSAKAPKTGMAMVEGAENIAIQWDKMARKNPKVRATLDRMLDGEGWMTVLVAYSSVGMMAVQESRILSRIPGLSRFFPTPPDTPSDTADIPTDEFGNPLPLVNNTPPPFERRQAS